MTRNKEVKSKLKKSNKLMTKVNLLFQEEKIKRLKSSKISMEIRMKKRDSLN
jgi:hypothetical protein